MEVFFTGKITKSLFEYEIYFFRNACEAEKANKEFNPLAYYQHIHSEKQLFFVVEPTKLDFLGSFKSDFAELFFADDKVEVRIPY